MQALQAGTDIYSLDADRLVPDDIDSAKDIVKQMLDEKYRADMFTKKLKGKVHRLDQDLAIIREEGEGVQREMSLVRRQGQEEAQGRLQEQEAQAKGQKDRIREYLSEVLYMKPKRQGRTHQFELDTVLVIYIKEGDPFRYDLSFRIDDKTTINQLRENVCKYWGVNPKQYILKTMSNSKCQNSILVTECFKHGEIAQLRLERGRHNEVETPTMEELAAIEAKDAKGRKKATVQLNLPGAEQVQPYGKNYNEQLKELTGVYTLLKQREKRASEHKTKIKLSDFFVYKLLALLTWVLFLRRNPSGEKLYALTGIETAFRRRIYLPNPPQDAVRDYIPGFNEIERYSEVLDWFQHSLPSVLWSDRSGPYGPMDVASLNWMAGYMEIRVQDVVIPTSRTEFCDGGNSVVVSLLANATCEKTFLSTHTIEKREFPELRAYFENLTREPELPFRGPANPGVFASQKESLERNNIQAVWGSVRTYSAAGYRVEYRMDPPDRARALQEYRRDWDVFLRHQWISQRSRAVVLSFTTYNFDYDLWIANDYLFELAVSGAVSTKLLARPFKMNNHETTPENYQTYLDYIRLILALYIFFFIGYSRERMHKIKNHKPGWWYYVSLNGICDMGIVCCLFVSSIWNWVVFARGPATAATMQKLNDPLGEIGFISFSQRAHSAESITCLEGLIMVFLMHRIVSLYRINNTVYTIWHTLGTALTDTVFFTIMFMPFYVGFVFIVHNIFGSHNSKYSLISRTLVQVSRLWFTGLDTGNLLENASWYLFFSITFYISMTYILMNIFLTVVVDAYYVVMLTGSARVPVWTKQSWVTWILPQFLANRVLETMERLNIISREERDIAVLEED